MNDDVEMAIAIKYDKEKDAAPRVVAKGMRLKAEKIREIARQYNIPFMKNVSLAQRALPGGRGPGGPRGAVRRGRRGAQLHLRAPDRSSRRAGNGEGGVDVSLPLGVRFGPDHGENQQSAPARTALALGRPPRCPREAGRPVAARPQEAQDGQPQEPGAGLGRAAGLHWSGALLRGDPPAPAALTRGGTRRTWRRCRTGPSWAAWRAAADTEQRQMLERSLGRINAPPERMERLKGLLAARGADALAGGPGPLGHPGHPAPHARGAAGRGLLVPWPHPMATIPRSRRGTADGARAALGGGQGDAARGARLLGRGAVRHRQDGLLLLLPGPHRRRRARSSRVSTP